MKTVPDSYIERNDMSDEPGPIDPDDLCMVCNKLECECPPEEDFGVETPPIIDQTPNETITRTMKTFQLWRNSQLLLAGCHSLHTPKREAARDSYNEQHSERNGQPLVYYIRDNHGNLYAIGSRVKNRMNWNTEGI